VTELADEIEPRDLLTHAPDAWREGEVWVSIYQAFEIPVSVLDSAPKRLNLGEVVAVLFHARLRYQALVTGRVEAVGDVGYAFHAEGGPQEAREAIYLALMTPLDGERSAKDRISAAAGLLAAFEGGAIVYQLLLETSVTAEGASIYSPLFVNPESFGRPNMRDEYLHFIVEAAEKVAALPEVERNRVQLALRWFDMAMHDQAVDSFLKYWFAIETMGMPDTTNIKPINKALAATYGISFAEARDRFQVGRLYDRRNRIVHHGDLQPVHLQLFDYMQAVFIDLLRSLLGLHPAHRIGRLLESGDFNLPEYL
jgi:hypothetical protein